MRERLDLLEAMMHATGQLPQLLGTLAEDTDDETARQRIASQLGCSEEAARAVLEMQLRRFRPAAARRISAEAAELRRALDAPADRAL